MLQAKIGQLKFWNKKLPQCNTQFLITSPNSLDNYFSTQRSKYSGGHLPIPVQFNQINEQQSLEKVLSKKIKGLRITRQGEKLLQKQLYFVSKINNKKIYFTTQQLFGYYLEYKSQDLVKARIKNEVTQKIIKPFIRINTSCNSNQHEIQIKDRKSVSSRKLAIQIHTIFKQILKDDINLNNQAICQPYQYKIQKYYTEENLKKNPKIFQEADKIIKKIQENNGNLQNKQEEQYKNIIKNIKISNKPTSCLPVSTKRIKLQKQMSSGSRANLGLKSLRNTTKNIKFKTIDSTQNDGDRHTENSFDLCQQLGLLIQDTDKILRPLLENGYQK